MAQQHLAVAARASNVGGMVQLERPRVHAPPSRPGCIEAVYGNAGGNAGVGVPNKKGMLEAIAGR